MLLDARIIVPYVYVNIQGRNFNSHMQYIYRYLYLIKQGWNSLIWFISGLDIKWLTIILQFEEKK